MFLGRKFHLQTGVTGPANAWSPLHYVPLRLACGNPSIPGADYTPRKPHTSFFRFLLSSSVRTDVGFYRVPLRFYLFQYPAQIIFRANRALVFFAFFCLRRLEPTFAFAGCSLRFYLFQYPCAVLYTAQTALLLFPLTSVFVG